MKQIILDDLYRYEGVSCKSLKIKLRYILFNPGFQFTYFFRKATYSKNRFNIFIWSALHRFSMWKFGFQIPIGTKIGRGFRISHFGTIIINGKAIIGNNFNIASGTLIGYSDGKNKGVPTIGDNVILNVNSVIVGNVKIGDNVLIAPNTFVNFDVPENSIVIGSPGRIISRDSSPTAKYIIYSVKNESFTSNKHP